MPILNKKNIYSDIPKELKEELFEDIIKKDGLKIERIVSYGHITDEFQWYEQENDEWVILLKGEAILSFENGGDLALHVEFGTFIAMFLKNNPIKVRLYGDCTTQ